MKRDKTKLNLLVLAIQSFLALGLAVLLPLFVLFGEKKVTSSSFAFFMLLGLIGISAYQAIFHLNKRVYDLERQADAKKHEQSSSGDGEVK